jgi:hypothetical protein
MAGTLGIVCWLGSPAERLPEGPQDRPATTPRLWDGYAERVAALRSFVATSRLRRFVVSWNPAAPAGFQAVDRLEIAAQEQPLCLYYFDEHGDASYKILYDKNVARLLDSRLKTIVTLDRTHRLDKASSRPEEPFARRVLAAAEAYGFLASKLSGAAVIEIEAGAGSEVLHHLYADRASVADLPTGARIRVERSPEGVDGQLIKVLYGDAILFEVAAYPASSELVAAKFGAFAWADKPRTKLPRPKLIDLIRSLRRSGLPVKLDSDARVELLADNSEILVKPLGATPAPEEIVNEECDEFIDRLKIIFAVSGPFSVGQESIRNADDVAISRHLTDGALDSMVMSSVGQSWTIHCRIALSNLDPLVATGDTGYLRALESAQRRKWGGQIEAAMLAFLASYSAARQR